MPKGARTDRVGAHQIVQNALVQLPRHVQTTSCGKIKQFINLAALKLLSNVTGLKIMIKHIQNY